jgi:predicted nucleic acid-binding protein
MMPEVERAVTDADPTRVVADADVLAADLLVGGAARDALDCVREHSWTTLVASDRLLADARAVVATLADDALASDWHDRVAADRERVEHPAGDHPGLASAYRGRAAHLLTFDDGLRSAGANLSLQPHMQVSVRTPAAFASLFDPAALYEATHEDAYPGPDRDPRG